MVKGRSEKTVAQLATASMKRNIPYLDKVIRCCLVMGVLVSLMPWLAFLRTGEPPGESYYDYVLKFWGYEFPCCTVIYAIKTLPAILANWQNAKAGKKVDTPPLPDAEPGTEGGGDTQAEALG